jgi:hypothetical protein
MEKYTWAKLKRFRQMPPGLNLSLSQSGKQYGEEKHWLLANTRIYISNYYIKAWVTKKQN